MPRRKKIVVKNADGKFLHYTDVKGALSLIRRQKVFILDIHRYFVHNGIEYVIPSDIQLYAFIKGSYESRRIYLNLFTVAIRDNFTCAYCGDTFHHHRGRPLQEVLTIDHVQPYGQGGKNTWLNVILACKCCNFSKGNRTPEQANMPLLFEPRIPTAIELIKYNDALVSKEHFKFYERSDHAAQNKCGGLFSKTPIDVPEVQSA